MKQRKNNPNESGIAHVAVVALVIAVIAATAFGGWWVWQNNKNESNKTESSQQTNNNSNSQSQEQTDPSEGGKYFVITEWGVRFLLPEDLRGDIYYQVRDNGITKLQRASFASNKLDSLAGNFNCSFKENPQIDGLSAGLLRLAPENQPAPAYIKDNLNPVKELENYDYYSSKPTELSCASGMGNDPHPDLYETEQNISDQLWEAFKTVEAIE